MFFGRDLEIRELSERVVLERLVVLFGKSGYGKTSLLRAGVIPRLRQEENYRVISIRFDKPDISPVEQLVAQLQEKLGEGIDFGKQLEIDRVLPDDWNSKVWCLAKSLQVASGENPWITLVFDPFEELFMYTPLQVDAFGRSLAALLNPRPPLPLRNLIKTRVQSGESKMSEAESNAWFSPLNFKALLSVRHDHLGSLERLKQFVPDIYKHTYELQPLNNRQALEALRRPAALEGDFASPPFTYSQEALGKIVEALKDERTQRIETYQLQLIGQRAEEVILEKARTKPDVKELELSAAELGNPELILENHYQAIVKGLPLKDRGKARWLVEKKLIIGGKRVPLPQAVLTEQYRVPSLLLNALVEKRLLRSELNSVGGTSFELSHDTLVGPILKSARNRRMKRLQRAAMVLLFLIFCFAAWGTIAEWQAREQRDRADSLQTLVRQKDSIIRSLQSQGGDFTFTDTDSLIIVIRQQQDTLDSLRRVIGAQQGIAIVAGNGQDPGTGGNAQAIEPPLIDTNTPDPPVDNGENPGPEEPNPNKMHSDWLRKMNILKAKLAVQPGPSYRQVMNYGKPSDTRAPGQWEFPAGALHLVAIRITPEVPRIFDAKNPEALYVILKNGKAYKFLGATGYFEPDGKTAFLAQGQHKMHIGRPRSRRTLVPHEDGVLLFGDRDGNGYLSDEDVEAGPLTLPNRDLSMQWLPSRGVIDRPGRQFISDLYYISPDDRTVSLSIRERTENNRETTQTQFQNAYEVFVSLVWELSEDQPLYYTQVDMSDFDRVDREEIARTINRLKTGREATPVGN